MISVLYLANDGSGFGERVDLEPETTIRQFLKGRLEGSVADFTIHVNREVVQESYVLQHGDKISVTRRKYEGG